MYFRSVNCCSYDSWKYVFNNTLQGAGKSSRNTSLGSNNYRFQVNNNHQPATTTSSPLVLSLSQIQGSGGLLILNSGTQQSPALTPARPAKDKGESMEVTWWIMSPGPGLVAVPLPTVCFLLLPNLYEF